MQHIVIDLVLFCLTHLVTVKQSNVQVPHHLHVLIYVLIHKNSAHVHRYTKYNRLTIASLLLW